MERTITLPGRHETLRRTIQLGPGPSVAVEAPGVAERIDAPGLKLAQWLLWAAIAAGSVLTLVLLADPGARFAYHNRELQAEIHAVAALAALLVALLALGHFRRTLLRSDLLLAAGLGLLGFATLTLALVLGLDPHDPSTYAVWLADSIRLLAAAVLATAAWSPLTRVRHPDVAAMRMIIGSLVVIALFAGVLALIHDQLPKPVLAGRSPAGRPLADAPAGALFMQGALFLTYGAAAVGLLRRRSALGLHSAAIAAAITLLALAWLNFFLFSPIYSPWVQSGDILWMSAFLVLLGWAATSIRIDQRDIARLALVRERGRVARELHDGLAQELVYMLGQARRLGRAHPSPEADNLLAATERALDETRAVISAFRAPADESLDASLRRLTGELERRLGIEIESNLAPDVHVAADVREAVIRITGEALTNAARHGQAERASVELREEEDLHLIVRDAGMGFDASRARRGGSFGLLVMRERAAAIGAKLDIRSSPDAGTEVEVIVP